jgi:hypothetical protein
VPSGLPLAVQVDVWDASGQEPGGRGLLIVDAVASQWGCYPADQVLVVVLAYQSGFVSPGCRSAGESAHG